MTQIIKVNPENFNEAELLPAAQILKNGGICAFPTETVYGLGANALIPEAVEKIFKAKGRPQDNPLIVHISDMRDVYSLCREVPETAKILMKKFWGGPLTLILKKSNIIPSVITAGLDTVAIRMPSHPVANALINLCAFPIAAPSANLSGKPSPTSSKHVLCDMEGRADAIIDGGDCFYGVESTVLDLTVNPPVILRPGAISENDLIKEIGMVKTSHSNDSSAPKCPGMKYRHYAPDAPMYLLSGRCDDIEERINSLVKHTNKKVGVLTYKADAKKIVADMVLSCGNDVNEYAARLFYNLRQFNQNNIDIIYAMKCESDGIGEAVLNRLYKASGGNTLELKNVLFVCTGNTCRSPMAAAILQNKHPNYRATSRGLSVPFSSSASENAVNALNKMGIDISHHQSAQITRSDMAIADIVLAMTLSHKETLLKHFPECRDKIFTLREYTGGFSDVRDPFGCDQSVYDSCAEHLDSMIGRIK